ncbi:MAG: hypothetical protein GY806_10580 [Gammaproteobacteria bacterium]|nr:hypothetical protein [Gammaproteobacteria bacterium]
MSAVEQSVTESMTVQAWLLTLVGGQKVAVGYTELCHLLVDPSTYRVPHSPRFCKDLVQWENRILPAFMLSELLGQSDLREEKTELEEPANSDRDKIFAVLGFNLGHDRAEYGAIALQEPPQLIQVNDADVCDLDSNLIRKRMIVKTSFSHDTESVPIINIKYLFTGVFSN